MPQTDFRLIPHGSADYHRACALREAVLRRPLGLAFSTTELSAESGQLHFGLFAGETLQACLTAVPMSATEAKLRQMAVRPEWQRRGLGRDLVKQVEAELARRGCAQTWLHARAEAVGFYARLGYHVEGDEFLELGLPHFKMRKTLAAPVG